MSLNETGKSYERPWGWYKTLEMQAGYQVKLIHVIPGGRLSLQSHLHRAEHWIIAKGTATVTVNESIQEYHANQVVFIPKEAKHRLENNGTEAIELIEVQIGNYLGEDDIIRYDDIYGRI